MKLSADALMVTLRPLAWLTLGAAVCVPLIAYPGLPDEIPRHYDLAGNVDAVGPKAVIFTLPMISLFVYGLMSIVQHGAPHLTAINAHTGKSPPDPTQMRVVLQAVKMLTCAMFAILSVRTVSIAMGHPDLVAPWLIWAPLGLILLTPLLAVGLSRR
jgi:uncharacterized membrane protein